MEPGWSKTDRRGHDARARFSDFRVDADGNACFQIIPRQLHFDTRADQNALESRDGAFLRDGTRGDGGRGDQLIFFTGKFHKWIPPVFSLKGRKDNFQ